MDSQEYFWQQYSPFIKQNLLVLVLGFFGLMFLGYGLIQMFSQKSSTDAIVLEKGDKTDSVGSIVVDVAGAVMKPGVYQLQADARTQNAIVKAGGLSDDADRGWVDHNINLAAQVSDGSKLYIPFKGDPAQRGDASNKQININTAKQSELESLSGIGPVTAQKIIDGRPYSTIDELVGKKVIAAKLFEKIKEKITTY